MLAPRGLKGIAARQVTAERERPAIRGVSLWCARTRETDMGIQTARVSAAKRVPKDPAEKAQEKTRAQLAAETAITDLLWLMGERRGRRIWHRLLERAGIYHTSYTGEALSSAFKEGRRNLGLELMNELLQHCPSRLSEMQRENLKHERSSTERNGHE